MKRWEISWRQTFNLLFIEEVEASSEKSAISKARKMAKRYEVDPGDYNVSTPQDEGDDFNALEIT